MVGRMTKAKLNCRVTNELERNTRKMDMPPAKKKSRKIKKRSKIHAEISYDSYVRGRSACVSFRCNINGTDQIVTEEKGKFLYQR